MQKLEAVHYGEVELIPGIKCDGYVLSDGTSTLPSLFWWINFSYLFVYINI